MHEHMQPLGTHADYQDSRYSESLGQEAACIHVRDNYSELLTHMHGSSKIRRSCNKY